MGVPDRPGLVLKLEAGKLSIGLDCATRPIHDLVVDRYAPFLSEGDATPVVRIEADPSLTIRGEGFRPDWSYREDRFDWRSPAIRCHVDLERGSGTLAVVAESRHMVPCIDGPLRFLFQILALYGESMLVHAATVVDPASGEATLFPAPSGTGKTTISRASAAAGCHVVTDDLSLVRIGEAAATISSTPFFGEYRPERVDRLQVPLGRICFLEQAPYNRLVPRTSRATTVARLLANVPFVDRWEPKMQARLLERAEQIASSVAAYDLELREGYCPWSAPEQPEAPGERAPVAEGGL